MNKKLTSKDYNDCITCTIYDGLKISLRNVMEVYGHDDSLPFVADIYMQANELGKLNGFVYVGKASNDGWGGDTLITPENAFQRIVEQIDKYLQEHYKISVEVEWEVRLEYLISVMAFENIYNHKTDINILDLENCVQTKNNTTLEVTAKPEFPKTLSKFNYADCVIVKEDESTDIVTLAMFKPAMLNIKKGSDVDSLIYYYCDGYEDFMSHLIKEYLPVNKFYIESVIKLY